MGKEISTVELGPAHSNSTWPPRLETARGPHSKTASVPVAHLHARARYRANDRLLAARPLPIDSDRRPRFTLPRPRAPPTLYSLRRGRFCFPLLAEPSLFHPHLTTLLFKRHRNYHRAPPRQVPLRSPSGTPILSMQHCLKHQPPRRVIEAPKPPHRPPRMPPRRLLPSATA
jgi:hypothetical protein